MPVNPIKFNGDFEKNLPENKPQNKKTETPLEQSSGKIADSSLEELKRTLINAAHSLNEYREKLFKKIEKSQESIKAATTKFRSHPRDQQGQWKIIELADAVTSPPLRYLHTHTKLLEKIHNAEEEIRFIDKLEVEFRNLLTHSEAYTHSKDFAEDIVLLISKFSSIAPKNVKIAIDHGGILGNHYVIGIPEIAQILKENAENPKKFLKNLENLFEFIQTQQVEITRHEMMKKHKNKIDNA